MTHIRDTDRVSTRLHVDVPHLMSSRITISTLWRRATHLCQRHVEPAHNVKDHTRRLVDRELQKWRDHRPHGSVLRPTLGENCSEGGGDFKLRRGWKRSEGSNARERWLDEISVEAQQLWSPILCIKYQVNNPAAPARMGYA